MTKKEILTNQITLFPQDISSGKMLSERSAQTKAKTLQQSSRKSSASSNRKLPMCLCLKRDGTTQELSWETDGALLGELITRNTGVSPNEDVDCRLSAILEAAPPQKYSLSAKACVGVLRRARSRNRKLPDILSWALKTQALAQIVTRNIQDKKPILPVTSHMLCDCLKMKSILYNWNFPSTDNPQEKGDQQRHLPAVYELRMRSEYHGGGKEPLIQTDLSDALCAANDQTIFCLQGNCIDRADTAGCNGKGWKNNISFTLNTVDRHAVCVPPILQSSAKTKKDEQTVYGLDGYNFTLTGDKSSTLGTNCGSSTGRNGVLVLNDQGGSVMDVSENVVATLRAQSHGHEPLILEYKDASAAQPNGFAIGYTECQYGQYKEGVGTIRASGGSFGGGSETLIFNILTDLCNMVRRLTPLECERLQGYPDGWTNIGEWTDLKGKKRQSSDTLRYQSLGNSIALPFWQWLIDRISAQFDTPPTMGSLFDGIGGFPLCWENTNGIGTAIWASEVEEFQQAVTAKHFPNPKI